MVYILLADGFEEMEALSPADVLRRGGVEVKLVGLEHLNVTGANRITVVADTVLADVTHEEMEMLVLPGGIGCVKAIEMDLFALAFIKKAYEQDKWLAAICAAPTILAHMGILDGRRAICYPTLTGKLCSADVQDDQPIVTDGRIITAEAAGVSIPFGLELLASLKGDEIAQNVARAIRYRG